MKKSKFFVSMTIDRAKRLLTMCQTIKHDSFKQKNDDLKSDGVTARLSTSRPNFHLQVRQATFSFYKYVRRHWGSPLIM
jgi:hypothetical protein